MVGSLRSLKDALHESDRPGGDRVCVALACDLRGAASGVQLRRLAGAMLHGRAALYRAMDRGASEVAGGALALRIPSHARQGVSRYFVQSFKSLSAIENTASALI